MHFKWQFPVTHTHTHTDARMHACLCISLYGKRVEQCTKKKTRNAKESRCARSCNAPLGTYCTLSPPGACALPLLRCHVRRHRPYSRHPCVVVHILHISAPHSVPLHPILYHPYHPAPYPSSLMHSKLSIGLLPLAVCISICSREDERGLLDGEWNQKRTLCMQSALLINSPLIAHYHNFFSFLIVLLASLATWFLILWASFSSRSRWASMAS